MAESSASSRKPAIMLTVSLVALGVAGWLLYAQLFAPASAPPKADIEAAERIKQQLQRNATNEPNPEAEAAGPNTSRSARSTKPR